jgi:hypothetical protein
MKIALFVEGQSDRDTLTALARQISPNSAFVPRVLARGDLLNAEKAFAYIEADIKIKHPDVTRVLLCPDSECTPHEDFLRIVQPIENTLKRLVGSLSVHYCGVIHATEAWLACDAAALARYLRLASIGESSARAIVNSCKPKQALRELFLRHGREFINVRDNPRLANEVNTGELIRRSKSFARFAELLRQG